MEDNSIFAPGGEKYSHTLWVIRKMLEPHGRRYWKSDSLELTSLRDATRFRSEEQMRIMMQYLHDTNNGFWASGYIWVDIEGNEH